MWNSTCCWMRSVPQLIYSHFWGGILVTENAVSCFSFFRCVHCWMKSSIHHQAPKTLQFQSLRSDAWQKSRCLMLMLSQRKTPERVFFSTRKWMHLKVWEIWGIWLCGQKPLNRRFQYQPLQHRGGRWCIFIYTESTLFCSFFFVLVFAKTIRCTKYRTFVKNVLNTVWSICVLKAVC